MHQQQKKTERMAEGQQAPQQQMSPEVQKKYEDFQKLQQCTSTNLNMYDLLDTLLGSYHIRVGWIFYGVTAAVSELVNKQSQLESQLNENTMVKEEFGKLDEESEVFKLRGPVLIKQDLEDAKQAVDGRLNFIKSNL